MNGLNIQELYNYSGLIHKIRRCTLSISILSPLSDVRPSGTRSACTNASVNCGRTGNNSCLAMFYKQNNSYYKPKKVVRKSMLARLSTICLSFGNNHHYKELNVLFCTQNQVKQVSKLDFMSMCDTTMAYVDVVHIPFSLKNPFE